MRRPYFSAFSCKDVLLLDLLHREAVQDQREDDGVFARSSFKTVSSSSRGKPSVIKKSIDKTVQYLIEELKKKLRPMKGSGDVKIELQL